jgi:hypothetical protein
VALRRGGVFVRGETIEIRVGVRRRVVAPRRAVARIDDDAIPFSVPVRCHRLLARDREVNSVAVTVDDPIALRTALAAG